MDRILGIGGEGLVLKDEILTEEDQKKVKKEVAVKFVKFEKNDFDDFDGPEEQDKYFEKIMENLGDFAAARSPFGGYVAPYADFAISEIHKRFFFIIGKLLLYNTYTIARYKINMKFLFNYKLSCP